MASFYKVSLRVATYKLNDVLSRLHGFNVSVQPEVTHKVTVIENNVAQGAIGNPKLLPAPDRVELGSWTPPAKKAKAKKAKRKQTVHRGLGWLIPKEQQFQERARNIILSRGVQPFDISGLISDTEKLGGANTWYSYKAAVYRAIRVEMDAGNLVRVGPGRYQRTGASFIETLGLSLETGTSY